MNTTEDRIQILYVDDESRNLTAFKASFRRNYDIYTAISAEEGAAILKEQPVHIIIADQRMPHITGVEFFQSIRKTYPNAIRILLTGYTDVNIIVDAINKGEIFRYINKPWNEFEVHNAIKNAYELFAVKQQLQNKLDELEKTNHELNRLVYSTSHDLRSPLASIISIVNLAKIEASLEDYVTYFGMIEQCATKMDDFILKIIEYYKSVRLSEENTLIDFNQLVKDSIDISSMQNRNVTFKKDIVQLVPFLSDGFRLSVILNNLISNAIKYQKPSEPNPFVAVRVNVNEHYASIIIEDNGIGIQEQNLDSIFQMFFRSTKNATGLGIGLFIVQEALARIGGEVNVKSEFGVGTTFYLQIPNRYNQQTA